MGENGREGEHISFLPFSPSPVFALPPFLCEPLRLCASTSSYLTFSQTLFQFVKFLARQPKD